MQGEGALYADTMSNTPNRKVSASAALPYPDYYSLKYLGTLFISLNNLDADLYHVTRGESGNTGIWFDFNR